MWSLARTAAIILAASWTIDRVGVPAGALLGGLVAAAALNIGGWGATALPPSGKLVGYAVVGWVIGQEVTVESIAAIRQAIVPVSFTVGSLVLVALIIGWALRYLGVDAQTGFLAASPGGLSQMAAISESVGADAPLVTVVHLARVVTVMVLAPIVARLAT